METPFAEYKGTELSQEQINGYFVEPKHISKMYPNNVSFVIGQRGTGKTTLLRYLSSSYNEDQTFPKKRLGVYYRFDVNKMHSFSGRALNDDEWSTLFAHCFSVEMCLILTDLLISLRNQFPLDDESFLCRKIRRLFFEESSIEVDDLDSLKDYLEHVDYVSKKFKRNPLRATWPMISECEKTFEEYCCLISKQAYYKDVCVHFLFDEYENMLDYQKEFINTCAKHAGSNHTYKICVRPYGTTDMMTRKNTEILREADDFKTLDYIADIIGDSDDVAKFMRRACERRLEKYYKERKTTYSKADLEIDKYFPLKKTDDDLFKKISKNSKYVTTTKNEVKRLFHLNGKVYNDNWDLLNMKLFLALSQKRGFNIDSIVSSINTQDVKYRNWINNYKKSIIFLCCSELGIQYEMSGFEDIITIAGNVVRYVLEICDYCFLCTDYTDDGKFSTVDAKMQTEAIYKVSQRRFQQISTIPHYGQEIKQMVLVIGTIFNMYHRDTQLKRFEPNHFSIERKNISNENYSESEIKKAIQLSVTYGVFEVERSTKNRNNYDVPIENEDFHLHPILTPYFRISWRKKQKCRFTMDEIRDFLFGSDQKVTGILEGYYQKTKDKSNNDANQQLSLLDLKLESY